MADTAKKCHFFLVCDKNTKGVSAKNESKLDFFTSMFNVRPMVKLEVCDATSELLDPMTLTPNFAKTSIFDFTDGLVLSAFGKQHQDFALNPTVVMVDSMDYSQVMESKRKIARFVAARLKVKAPLLSMGEPSSIAPFSVAVIITFPLTTSASGTNVVAGYIT